LPHSGKQIAAAERAIHEDSDAAVLGEGKDFLFRFRLT